ncbi:MAG: heavy metal transporter [Chryseolinea sp.]
MGKIIRPTYPKELSIGVLLLVFATGFFLSGQIFHLRGPDLNKDKNEYVPMILLSCSVIIMILILWEEILFPIRVKSEDGGVVFRNHRTKLNNQALIYFAIPAIFIFVYMEYAVNQFYFFIWAAVCIILPVAGKLISGIKNYNDFLKLTDEKLEYKNNKEAEIIPIKDITQIILIKDTSKVLHKVEVVTTNTKKLTIDLDEMELDAFYVAIDQYITTHYKNLVK